MIITYSQVEEDGLIVEHKIECDRYRMNTKFNEPNPFVRINYGKGDRKQEIKFFCKHGGSVYITDDQGKTLRSVYDWSQ